MSRHFNRMIYYYYTFPFVKERQFRSSDAVTSISVLQLVMAIPRESHSKEIRSKSKSVYENALTGIQWSCMLLLIGSCEYQYSIGYRFQTTLFRLVAKAKRIIEAMISQYNMQYEFRNLQSNTELSIYVFVITERNTKEYLPDDLQIMSYHNCFSVN